MSPRRIDLFVMVDALGDRLARTHGFLNDLLPHRAPLETVLGYTATCIPTILTGAYPEEHDHFSFFLKGSQTPFRALAPLAPLDLLPGRVRSRLRNPLARLFGSFWGWDGYLGFYDVPFARLAKLDYSEKKDLYRPGGIRGGQETLFDVWAKRGTKAWISNWRRGDAGSLQDIQTALKARAARCYYLYLSEIDGALHRLGPDDPQVGSVLAKMEDQLREVYQVAKAHHPEVHLHVFSDHGMAAVRHHHDLAKILAARGLRAGEDFEMVRDSTMARFWFPDPARRSQVTDALAGLKFGRVLSPEDKARYRIRFQGDHYGEEIFLLEPGHLLVPSDLGERPVRGMHGYRPEHEDSRASLLSTEAIPTEVSGLVDLKDHFLELSRRSADGDLSPEPVATSRCFGLGESERPGEASRTWFAIQGEGQVHVFSS